ncbi:hypothetical protein C8Q80DRAFT_194549 [Daedaleopsis nitida]|nr:hypothetical protein C8Q80DRAFT_194549 [Daedaleopsis nitida]
MALFLRTPHDMSADTYSGSDQPSPEAAPFPNWRRFADPRGWNVLDSSRSTADARSARTQTRPGSVPCFGRCACAYVHGRVCMSRCGRSSDHSVYHIPLILVVLRLELTKSEVSKLRSHLVCVRGRPASSSLTRIYWPIRASHCRRLTASGWIFSRGVLAFTSVRVSLYPMP